MGMKELSYFGLYSQKENEAFDTLLQVSEGGSFAPSCLLSDLSQSKPSDSLRLPFIFYSKFRLRCRAPAFQPSTRMSIYFEINSFN